MNTTRFAFYGLLALALLQVVVFYPRSPEVMASHFDASGQADGSMSKQAFFALDLAVVALTALLFLGFPAIRWSDGLISLPRKDHWLAPERREATFRYIHRQMLLFGCLTLGLLLVVVQWVIQANLEGTRTLAPEPMWWLLGLYALMTGVWVVRWVRHFYRVPEDGLPDGI